MSKANIRWVRDPKHTHSMKGYVGDSRTSVVRICEYGHRRNNKYLAYLQIYIGEGKYLENDQCRWWFDTEHDAKTFLAAKIHQVISSIMAHMEDNHTQGDDCEDEYESEQERREASIRYYAP